MTVKIQKSVITVECELDEDPGDISQLMIRAGDAVRAIVNLNAFYHGHSMAVLMDSVTRNGEMAVVYNTAPETFGLCTAFRAEDETFSPALFLAVQEPLFGAVLHDLIQAMSVPHYSPIGCARTMEGLRHLIAPGMKRDEQWAAMHRALNTSRAYLAPIFDASKDHRHGNRVRLEGEVTSDIIRRSWVVMNRYLALRLRGHPLSLSEFPVLPETSAS